MYRTLQFECKAVDYGCSVLTFWWEGFLFWRSVLCIVGCFEVCLTSTHYMTVALPFLNYDNQTFSNVPWGGKSSLVKKHYY